MFPIGQSAEHLKNYNKYFPLIPFMPITHRVEIELELEILFYFCYEWTGIYQKNIPETGNIVLSVEKNV